MSHAVKPLTLSMGYHPRRWQEECHRAMRRFTVLVLHRRAGKTEMALMELIDKAMRFNLEMGLFFYVCPLLKQTKTVAWARLKSRLESLIRVGLIEVNESELWVKFKHNGAVIRLFGADNPDAMRGVRLDGAVLDEVAQMKPETWSEIIRPALADRRGWALFIGTPKGINLFSEVYFKANRAEANEWIASLYTCYDTDALPPEEIREMRDDMSEESFKREMLCDFTAAGEDQLISLHDAQAAAEVRLALKDYHKAPKVIGVDPARFGDDRSVIFPRQGLAAMKPIAYNGIDNMRLADKVARRIDDWEPDAVFIDAGQGAGVIDRLTQLNYEVMEVAFAGKPSNPRFLNKRVEMWWEMKEWLQCGGAIPDLRMLKQELATPTYTYNIQDKIQLEAKADIKKRGLPSPDLADALALTFAQPVRAKSLAEKMGGVPPDKNGKYDPYADLRRN